MGDRNHYSLARAKRSLLHFGIGKAASAALGIVFLVLSVRILPTADYGAYVALIAFLELFYIVTGFGLSTIAQRYVAEFRMRAHPVHFRRFVGGLFTLRIVFAAFASGIVLAIAPFLLAAFELPLDRDAQWLVSILLVLGSCTRYLDEIFPSLLQQAYTQGLFFLSNVLRATVLASAAFSGGTGFGFVDMLYLELGASLVAAVLGASLLVRYLKTDTQVGDHAVYSNQRMWPVALRFYFVQLIGQTYGPNVIKLLLSRMLGIAQTAVFGFLQAIADMIRNYMPAYLLATWVRPLMVARYVERRDMREVSAMANVVTKLSIIGVTPFAAFFATHGDAFAGWISAGKYNEAAAVWTILMALVAMQSIHNVMSMVTVTVERASANVIATMACCLALPLAIILSPVYGLVGVASAMVLAECLWVGIVWTSLNRNGLTVHFDLWGIGRIIAAGLMIAALLLPVARIGIDGWYLLPLLALSGIGMLAILALLKPFTGEERVIIGKLIPPRFIVW